MYARASLAIVTLAALLGASTSPPVFASQRTRLIVEVIDAETSLPYPAQALGRRAPRTYQLSGQSRVASDLRRWRAVDVASSSVDETIAALSQDSEVVSVRREYTYRQVALPNDPQFAGQYGLNSTSFPLADINAPEAWDKTTGSSGTTIAIIDGGVDLAHEDLSGKLWTNDDAPGDGVDNDGNGFIDDTHGWDFIADQPAEFAIDHATHVAGIAAAAGNNGVGVAGVDWGARIMSVRVLGSGGVGTESAIIEGINYAVANGAKIINLSIAGTPSGALSAAIENAYAAGVVVIAATGNNGANTDFFSIYPVCAEPEGVNLVLGVGATDDEGEPANFSNYGRCLDVSAPGKKILSTEKGNDYGTMSGTSMAAPFAAGVAGLYLAVNPGASPADVMNAIINGADPFAGEDADEWNQFYKGKLNAAAVVGASSSGGSSDSGGESSGGDSGGGDSGGGGGGSGGGGGGDSGGGGGGGGGEEPQPSPSVSGAIKVKPNLKLLPKVNAAFREVFGRNPNQVEHRYWYGRVKKGEKQTFNELIGAMRWQAAHGRTYVPSGPAVAGASTGSLVSKINAIHRTAYGRNPTGSEHGYWISRVVSGEKSSEVALLGAMIFHRVAGIAH